MKKLALTLALFLLNTQLFSSTFHAIVIADTASEDVRQSARIDIKKMRIATKRMARASGKKLALTVLDNHNVTIDKLKKWVIERNVGRHDILFFYFTGHGFASNSSTTIWPNLFFRTNKESVSMQGIKEALENKNARLTIMLSDSCNRYGPSSIPFIRSMTTIPKINISFPAKKSGLKRLFNKKRGKILASGAVPGTSSYGSDYGGFFTQAFLIAMEDESHTSKPSWRRMFKKTNKLLKNAQTPQSRVYLKKK